ncbi:MAG: DUF1552 domain-containing protein [Myxococcales bacterium]|nr:DUF1552 domain-containing protein [Myxococcales bacterium]
MKMRRRVVLKGIGGAALALPWLEGLAGKAAAQGASVPPYAIFVRQGNGVKQQWNGPFGLEADEWFPKQLGAISAASLQGQALESLTPYASKLLVVRGTNQPNVDSQVGCGHARGGLTCLTAQGPTSATMGAGVNALANGESLDHRIGRELNPDGRESLALLARGPSTYLDYVLTYSGPGARRNPVTNPWTAYQTVVGEGGNLDTTAMELLQKRRKSVNDLVRDQMTSLMSSPKLSAADKQRLELHFDSIRDLEDNLMCNLDDVGYAELEGKSPGYASDLGDEVLQAARAHMDIAVLAVACGYTRSAAIQIGSGNDGSTRYSNLDDNAPMENFHYLSHRRLSHDAMGDVIPNSDLLHHYVDIHFMRAYKYLLDKLSAVELINGDRLLDCGVAVFLNDLGNGPAHSARDVPIVLAGSAGGLLKQGQHVTVNNGDYLEGNHAQLLNTIGTAAGLRKNGDQYLDDFGDPALPKGVLSELLA